MPPFQTTTALRPAKGYPGMMANMEEWNAFTAFAEGATVGFGQPVKKGTGDDQVALLTSGTRFIGIARANIDSGAVAGTDGGLYAAGSTMGVIDEGVIFVTAGAAVTKGQLVYWLPSSGRYFGASATGRIPLTGCEFDDSAAAAGDVVAIRVRITPGAAVVTAAA